MARSATRSRRSRVSWSVAARSEEHTSELQSRLHLVCRLLLEKKTKHVKLARHSCESDSIHQITQPDVQPTSRAAAIGAHDAPPCAVTRDQTTSLRQYTYRST